jgi:hypothetical protein
MVKLSGKIELSRRPGPHLFDVFWETTMMNVKSALNLDHAKKSRLAVGHSIAPLRCFPAPLESAS